LDLGKGGNNQAASYAISKTYYQNLGYRNVQASSVEDPVYGKKKTSPGGKKSESKNQKKE